MTQMHVVWVVRGLYSSLEGAFGKCHWVFSVGPGESQGIYFSSSVGTLLMLVLETLMFESHRSQPSKVVFPIVCEGIWHLIYRSYK